MSAGPPARTAGSRAPLVYSCLGHLYVHLFTALFFVIVLAIEDEWGVPYPDLIELWTLGSLLVGAGALPAGMLADRIGARWMMVAFFLGLGAASVAAGLARTPGALMVALAALGLFASIYHPVGIPWLVRGGGAARGRALGVNGIFGTLGSAGAGLVAGALIDTAGWRAAFVVPGAVCVATGLALLAACLRGAAGDEPRPAPVAAEGGASAGDRRRVFAILVVTMFLAGVVYHTTQTALPKVFAQRHQGLAGDGALGVGLLVAAVYTAAGVIQVVGGYLADRFPLKPVYLAALAVQVPLLWLAASLGGAALVVVATLMVMSGVAALPAENLLLARYTPAHRHGLAFGIKFVLAFGAAPLSVILVSRVSAATGGLYWVFVVLAGLGLVALLAASLLPGRRARPVAAGAGSARTPAPLIRAGARRRPRPGRRA